MGKGSNTSTSNTTTAPNPQAMQAYSDLMARAQGVADTPYTPYGGEIVAPFNAQQNTGVAGINQYSGFAQPYIQQAAGLATNAASPITAAQIQQYESPYTQQVIDATQAQFDNQNQRQMQSVKGNAIAQGALGGNREAIAEAETANQQQLAQAPVIAGLRNQGYQTGLNTALTQQQAQAAGAYSLGNLGVSGQNAGLTGATAQLGAGTAQQQTQQAKDAAAYQQFLTQQAYPFQTAQWLAGIDTGVGSQMGGTSSGSTTAPAPNSLNSWLGLGAAGIGAAGQAGVFSAMAPAMMAMLASGGSVGRANGGVAPDPENMTVPETHDTLLAQQRQLVAGHRRAQMFPHGTPELNVPHGMRRVQAHSGVFHYDPKKIDGRQIQLLAEHGRENELLDLGPVSKDEVIARIHRGELPLAVVERQPDGTEVRAAAGTHVTAHHQVAAMQRTKSPGNRIQIEDVRHTLEHRIHRAWGGRVQNFDLGGGVANMPMGGGGMSGTPYSGAHGWVPSMNITPGHGAPTGGAPGVAPQQNTGPSTQQLGNQIGAMAKAISSGNAAAPLPSVNMGGGQGIADAPSMEDFNAVGEGARFGGRIGHYASGGIANLPDHNRIMMPHGFADGGMPDLPFDPTAGGGLDMSGTPYAGAKGYVPGMNITRGQGAPHASAPGIANQPASDPAKMGAQIGAMAKAISGGFNNKPMDISTPAQGPFTPSPVGTVAPIGLSPETFTPTELSGSDGAVYRRGGMVGSYAGGGVANLPTHNRIMMPHGYADGGLARAGQMFNAGAKDWWESGPQRVYSDFQGNGDSTNRGGFDNRQNLIDKYKTEDSTLAADEQPAGRAFGGVAHGYADGGMPYDNGIPFDPTAGGIAPGPDQFNVDPSVNAVARDILSGGAPLREPVLAKGDRGAVPPSVFDQGVAPSFADRALAGDAGQPPKSEFDASTFAPSAPASLVDQGVSGASVPLDTLTSPGFGGVPSAPVTGMEAIPVARATDIATPTAGYADNMDRIAAAHRQIESGGNYGKLGLVNPKTGDQAYGAYQVMGANVPVWTKEYLGRSMTPQEFLHDKNAQDAVYKARMGQYIGQYGLNGALDHWLGMGKADFTGTTHPQYQQKFMTALNGGAGSAGGHNGVADDTGAITPEATLTQSTPENTGVAAPSSGIDFSSNSKLWPALMAAGAGMMSSRSPFLGNAVGEGIQSGMGQYSAEKQQEMKQHQIDLEAKRLTQQADFQQKELALKTMPYSQMTAHEKAEIEYKQGQLARNKYRYEPGTGIDPETGQIVPGMYRLPILTDDPDADRKFFPNQTISGRTARTMTSVEIDREARLSASLEVGKRPDPNDLPYIGKPGAYDKALGAYQTALDAAITRHRQDMRTRYGITTANTPAASGASPAPGSAPAAPAAVPPKAPAAAAPVNAAAAAPAKPPFVKQNGRLYGLQSDGSYKVVQ